MRRVLEDGETFAQAAAWASVWKATVWEWVRRWRVPDEEAARICELREQTGWTRAGWPGATLATARLPPTPPGRVS